MSNARPVHTTAYVCCDTCCDIVAQGYSDALDDTLEHLTAVNRIDGLLLPSEYWLEQTEIHADRWGTCELCQIDGEIKFTVFSAR